MSGMPSMDAARVWRREGLIVGGWLALSALFGLVIGHVLGVVLLGVCGYLAMQMIYAWRLHRWLLSDRREPPDGFGVWREIYTELYRLKRRNRQRKKRLGRIVSEFQASTAALPDGAVVLDAQGRIVWFNDAAAALLALRRPQDSGQRLANLLRHPTISGYLANATGIDELEIPSPVNEDDTLLLRLTPYGNDQRLLIARDISEHKRLAHTRRDFVANASHELRTPLTVLRGYLEMMAEESAAPGALAEWQAPISEMDRQAQRMDRIIASLLTLARIEGEGLSQRQAQIDVPALIGALVDGFRRTPGGAVPDITLDIDPELELFARAGELESVFSNLLSNAVRYTPATGAIHVRWWREDGVARFCVMDTGPGIDANHIPRLTERFYRVDAARESGSGGTGLGLAIVKHCLEHHEGELHIESAPGEGSTFTCSFPAQRTCARRSAQPAL